MEFFRRFLALGVCLLAIDVPSARADPVWEKAPQAPHRHTFVATVTADDGDAFFGFGYRIRLLPRADVGLHPFASFRPKDHRTLERLRPHFYIQRNESYRNVYGLTADGIAMLGSFFGVYGGLGGGYSHGNYAGTGTDPGSGWSWVVDAGVTVRRPDAPVSYVVRAGYRHADRFIAGNHMGYVALGVEL